MKTFFSNRTNHGMTLLEAMVVVFLLFMLAIVLLPALVQQHRHVGRISCISNVKQIGIAFRIWEGDHNDKYPMSVSVTNGGAMEAIQGGALVEVFQVMSNELCSPKVLHCWQDEDHPCATNFGPSFAANNVSYFLSPDINDEHSPGFLSGDDNFEVGRIPVKSGLLEISSNTPVAWPPARHKFSGNIALADGSAQGMNNVGLNNWLHSTNFTTMRLDIP